MPDEIDKPGGDPEADISADGTENERPTVSPPFDPVAFARDVSMPSAPPVGPAAGGDSARATPPRGTEATEDAGASRGPGGAPSESGAPSRRRTPTTTLSLANARIPSQIPPRPAELESQEAPPRRETLSRMNAVDREWADLELATRPPPPGFQSSEAVPSLPRDLPPPLDLDDVGAEDDVGMEDDVGTEDEHGALTVRRPITLEPGSSEAPKPRDEEMKDRVSLGDYSGALEIAEAILADVPGDAEAHACAESCRTVLRQMYATRIGPLDHVPTVAVPRDQLRWLSIDHKAGFVLSLVDGVSSLEMILDVSGMPELDALRILSELVQQRIISLK